MPAAAAKAPWKKTPPKGASHTKLSSAARASAKSHAKKAGRPYPNLVDNMNATKRTKK